MGDDDVDLVERGFRGDEEAHAKFRDLLKTGKATKAQIKRMDELLVERCFTDSIRLSRLGAPPEQCALERAIVRLVQRGFAGYSPPLRVAWPVDGDCAGGWAIPGTAFFLLADPACGLAADEDSPRWRRECGALAVLLLILHRERDPDAREQWEGLRDTYARPTFSFGPDGQPRRGPDGGFIFNEKPPGFVNPIRDLRGTLSAASQAGVIVGDAGALVRDYLATSVLACTLPEAVRRALASLEHAAAPDFLPTLLDLTTDGKAWLLAGKELRFPKTETAGVRGSRRVTRRSDAGLFLESLLRPGGVPWAGGGAPEGRSHLCAALAAAGGQMRLEGTGATVQLVPRPVLAERARVALKGASRG